MTRIYLYLLDHFPNVAETIFRSVLFAFSIMCIFAISNSSVLANPTGAQIDAGNVTVTTPAPNVVQIDQSSDKAIINWQSFNIGAQEKTQFIQPSASSIALNRINPNQLVLV
jgi:large exoprotein involved in heme utilization and adhesion